MTIYDDQNFIDHTKPRKSPEEVVRERFACMREQTMKALQESTLPEWAKQIECLRVDRTADDSWLFQWEKGSPCTLLDFYDNGVVVALGPDPTDELPERESYAELTLDDREWLLEFARTGWNGVKERQIREDPSIKTWKCEARGHLTHSVLCPDVCRECKQQDGSIWLSMFERL